MDETPAAPAPETLGDLLDAFDTSLTESLHLAGLAEANRRDQARLVVAIEAFARLLPPRGRHAVLERLAHSEPARQATDRDKFARTDRSKRMRAVKRWLIKGEHEDFQVFELTAHLRRQGFHLPQRYAANVCRELVRQGLLRRLGRGRYGLNRADPEVARLLFYQFERRARRFRELSA